MSRRSGRPTGVFKRGAEVPIEALYIGGHVSKADLLEAAYHLASLCHDGGCDDAGGTVARLKQEIDILRERRGLKALKIVPPPTAEERATRRAESEANFVAQGGKL